MYSLFTLKNTTPVYKLLSEIFSTVISWIIIVCKCVAKETPLLLILTFWGLNGFSQYLPNPSFEGIPQPNIPPPGWQICNSSTSTPDVQPGNFGVYLPPSNGETYLGMTVRDDFTWEDVHSSLITPLSMDSCYIFKMDFAYQQDVAGYNMQPIVLRIYGYNSVCDKNHLLWTSPAVANTEWQTYEFMVHPDVVDITDLVMEVYYYNNPSYWGYMLMDNIRINPTPKIDLGNDTTLALCQTDSLILDPGSGFYGYLWQDGSTGQTYSVDTTGLYWVQVYNSEGCSWTDSIFVTIEEYLQMETEMYDSLIVCEGQEITLGIDVSNGVQPYVFEWKGLPDTTSFITLIADTTLFYIVTVTDNCGNMVSDSLKLVVKQGPEINLGNDTLICSDGDYTIHAGPGYFQYTWQDGSTDSVLTITEPGTYWVTVTSFYGCNSTDSININLFPALPLDLGNDTTACLGETVMLYAGEGYVTYVWQDNSSEPEYLANTTGIYWVTVTDDKGCSATDSIFVSFLSLPVIDLGPDTSICYGDPFLLDAGDGYVSYLWQSGDTSQYFAVTQTGTYSVTVNNGCGEATDAIHVEVFPLPDFDLGPDTTICPGQSLTLEPGSQFISYQWQDNSSLPFFVVTTSGIYSVEVENNFGCKVTDEIYVAVTGPQINLGEDSHICNGDSLVLDPGSGFISYLWQDTTTSQTLVVKTSGNYAVIVQDQYGCTGSDEIIVSFYPYPISNLGDDKEICTGDTLLLTAPSGDYTYYWNGQPGSNVFPVSSSGNYTLAVVNPCDSVTDNIQVTEVPVPVVNLGEDEVIVPGQTIELDAGEGYDSYLWQDGSGGQYFVVTVNNINPKDPYYYVEVTEGICKSSDTVKIELFEVWVPRVITPNDDGQNDLFRPDPDRWQGIKQHRMVVFNRWGEKVWESDDFPSGWDGKQNGRSVAEGTYFWVLEVYYGSNDIRQTLKGSLTILGTSR